jgi:osmoprotectant transport system permease protein
VSRATPGSTLGQDPEEAATATAPPAGASPPAPGRRRRPWLGYLVMPALLGLACLLLFVWLQGKQLDSIEQRLVNADVIWEGVVEHVKLSVVSTFFVIVIAVPLGILLTRSFAKWVTPGVVALANIGQMVPSIGVLVLLALVWTIGFRPAVVALVAYAVLPVLRNTMVGLQQVDRSVIEAGRGMGMTKRRVLTRIELPLAVPVILAGVRTALVINVGAATLATFVNAGGLGDIISGGLSTSRDTVIITGAVLTAVLALFVDWVGGIVEDLLRPKGI